MKRDTHIVGILINVMMLVIILNCSGFLILPIDLFGMSMVYITLRFLCAKLFAMNLSATQDGENPPLCINHAT